MNNINSALLLAAAVVLSSAQSLKAAVPEPIAVPEPATSLLLLVALGGGYLFAKHFR
jgi:hypothetical protein